MKWPETLTVVRHEESEYNELKQLKESDPVYQEFIKVYNRRKQDPKAARELAQALVDDGSLQVGKGDHETDLTDLGRNRAKASSPKLGKMIGLPDVVFVSPYNRTRQTYELTTEGWPELAEVPVVVEERLREQEHGLALLYSDWKIFHILHPEQEQLRSLEGPYYYRYPQGENVPDVRERVRSWLGALTRDYREQKVLAFTHHLSILSLVADLERLSPNEFIRLDHEEKPVNGGVTVARGYPELGRDGKLVIDIYNKKLY